MSKAGPRKDLWPVSLTRTPSSYLLAIDPGNTESAYTLVELRELQPVEFGKVDNHRLLEYIHSLKERLTPEETITAFIIERVASYGMAVGRDVFETCEWIGRFTQAIYSRYGKEPDYVGRKEEKSYICHDLKAKDSNIRRALIDRFAHHDLKNGKGTKKNPDWFYGFHADTWAAYAVAITWVEKTREAIAKMEE